MKKLRDADIPEPDAPPEPLEPEFVAALTRFMEMQKEKGFRRFVWGLGADDLIVTPEKIVYF